MALINDQQVANTRLKLARLEARYERLRQETDTNQRVRDLSMHSLKRLINEFKEEIARYECRCGSNGTEPNLRAPRGIQSEAELDNTRRKLTQLEALLEAKCENSGDDAELRRAERISLRRLINQFKEEIARYKAHQLTR